MCASRVRCAGRRVSDEFELSHYHHTFWLISHKPSSLPSISSNIPRMIT